MSKNNRKEKKDNNYIWFFISLLLPFVGIVMYFIYKSKKKKASSKILTGTIVGFCFYSIVLLAILGNNSNKIGEGTAKEWYNDVTSGKEVVTVIGGSFCPHCQEYKPIIKKIANKYKFNFYFFEIDLMEQEDKEIIENTYQLTDFTDNIPFTFIVKNNQYITGKTGFSTEDDIKNFLKEQKIIKD